MVVSIQAHIIEQHVQIMNDITANSLQGSNKRWELSTLAIKTREPFGYQNILRSMGHLNRYLQCIEKRGSHWIGLKFHFPFFQLALDKYRPMYEMKEIENFWGADIRISTWFREPREDA